MRLTITIYIALCYQFNPCVDTDCWFHTLHIVPPVPGYKQNLSWRENNLGEYKCYLTAHFIGLVLLSLLACHVYEREGKYGSILILVL